MNNINSIYDRINKKYIKDYKNTKDKKTDLIYNIKYLCEPYVFINIENDELDLYTIYMTLRWIFTLHNTDIKKYIGVTNEMVSLWMYNYGDRIRFYIWVLQQLPEDNYEIKDIKFEQEIFAILPNFNSYDVSDYLELYLKMEDFLNFIKKINNN